MIDSFSEKNKERAALSLEAYWKNHGKWVKKDCSKKQWVKVQRVKAILSEE
jgi:hypothetical protein